VRALLPSLLACCALAWGIALGAGALASPSAPGGGGPVVVATTTQVADLVRRVAGNRFTVVGLLSPSADPHEHEVRPGDVRALARARLVFRSGGDVDGWLGGAVRASGTRARVVDLSRSVRRRGDDPHWWQDPRNGALAALAIGRALGRPAAGRAEAARLRRLDGAIAACWRAVPRTRRRLVTTHDAYGYYAHRYGLRFVGAVIPALTSRAQPSARALARLAATIRRDHVRAVFAERALNSGVERAVAEQGGARIGRPLWGDALGPPGSAGATYAGALASDTRALVDGLAGRPVRCRLP
jgi:ABC-type Zn uptake system ZnuABC Zn-binding protein ZnuA